MTPLAAPALLALALLAVGALVLSFTALQAERSRAGLARTAYPKGVRVGFLKKLRWFAKNAPSRSALLMAPLAALGFPMVAGVAWKTPANDVYAGPFPRDWAVVNLKVKTAANLRSGRVAKKDTTDDEIQLAAAGDRNALVIVGTRNWTNPEWDHTTAPAVGDEIECFYLIPGGAYKFRNGANLAAGDRAQVGATALAAGAVAAAGDSAKHICRVLVSADGSGAEGDILAAVI